MEESQKQGLRSAVHEIRQNTETYTVLLLGTTVFRGPRNFEPSRGIWPLPRNFHVSAEFHGIRENSAERPNSVILYCCCTKSVAPKFVN